MQVGSRVLFMAPIHLEALNISKLFRETFQRFERNLIASVISAQPCTHFSRCPVHGGLKTMACMRALKSVGVGTGVISWYGPVL